MIASGVYGHAPRYGGGGDYSIDFRPYMGAGWNPTVLANRRSERGLSGEEADVDGGRPVPPRYPRVAGRGGMSGGDARVTGLALAAGRGDRAAAAAFVAATQQDVWRFLGHLAGRAEADDLTQETYLRALRSLPGFAGQSSARTWLFTIARRVVVDQVRTAAVRPRVVAGDDWQGALDAARPGHAPRFEDGVVLRRLLDGLPADRRVAFVATQVLGLSYEEAAQVCGCPVGTIRSRVARAREDLVAAMAESAGDRVRRSS
jgi:RNA polymerase sigma-70 factor (ECF subfamily)